MHTLPELHRDIQMFAGYIHEQASEMVASDTQQPPIDYNSAYCLAAQAVVEMVRYLYERAEKGTIPELKAQLIDQDNWPPRTLPDYDPQPVAA